MSKGGGRRCVFCGRKPVTREHVWPQWLRRTEAGAKLLTQRTPEAGRKAVLRSLWSEHENKIYLYPDWRGQPASPQDMTVKVPCRSCNGGWMSRLEVEAQRVLTPLMSNREARLAAEDVPVVRRWARKTAAMFEFDDPTTVAFNPEVYQALREDREPPGHWYIAAAWATDSSRFRIYHSGATARIDRISGAPSLMATLGQTIMSVDRLVIMVRFASTYVGAPLTAGLLHLPQPLIPLTVGQDAAGWPDFSDDDWMTVSYGRGGFESGPGAGSG